MNKLTRWTSIAAWGLLLVALVDLALLKVGVLSHPPAVLAALFVACLLAIMLRIVLLVWRLASRRSLGLDTAAEVLLLAGLCTALISGSVNWFLGVQGTVILNEGETVALNGGSALQAFEAGPLARVDELGWSLALEELDLVPSGEPGGLLPVSRLLAWRGHEEPARLEVSPVQQRAAGALRFHQGAFGFAPRIVILHGERTVFDRVVPFRTRRHGPAGVSFGERFDLEQENLELEGAIELQSLDEGLRGHATLALAVRRGDESLGQGRLLLGHFAEIEGGYRLGFAGLEKWSEIVISRRNYGQWMRLGLLLALIGAVFWPVARWRAK